MNKLIFKYLSNELSLKEWQELKVWLEESPLNRITLNNLESYWKNHEEDLDVKREVIWDGLKTRLAEEERKAEIKSSRHVHLFNYLKVAAILIIAVTFSFILHEFTKDNSDAIPSVQIVHKMTISGQKLTTSLPDGSIVTLNSESQISFPEKFESNKREVELTGEAFFEVEHDPDRPFYVKSNNSVIKVLGTSFNVRTYQDEKAISVAVATGRVSFLSPDESSEVVLEPDEMISYNHVQKQLIKKPVDKLKIYGWKDKILYFKNERFDQIIKQLERWYGVRIIVQKDFSHKGNFSGEFKNKSLENVLMGLSYLYEFDYIIDKNIVTLK